MRINRDVESVLGNKCVRYKITTFFYVEIVSQLSESHSGTEGGGNAPKASSPTAVKTKEEDDVSHSLTSTSSPY